MEENGEQDKQEVNSHVTGHYFKVSENMSRHATGDVSNYPPLGDESLRRNKPNQGNKHSYFLRTKTPHFMGYHYASDEEGEFKNSSSCFGKNIVLGKERTSPLFSSPTLSPGSKSGHLDDYSASSEEEDLAHCLVMLSNKSYALSGDHKEELPEKSYALSGDHDDNENKAKQVVDKGMFQCKSCKKIFNSHQALGGHRASHKKVKGCFAAKLDGIISNDENIDEDLMQEEHEPLTFGTHLTRPVSTTSTRKRRKMHECLVCRRVFSSGQALGGHKRCHWLTPSTDNAFIPTFPDFQYNNQNQQICKKPMFTNPHRVQNDQDHQLDLNLNHPAPLYENQVDDNTVRFETSTRFYLQPKLTTANNNQQKILNTANGKGEKGCDEMNKVRKLIDLRDVNYDGGWLQIGIASTADIY